MFQSATQLGFPRRVVSCYLLFCMIAVTWLSMGVVFTVHTILSSRAESECLAQIGKAAAAIEIDYVRHGRENVGSLVRRIGHDGRFASCAVVDSSGKFIAHTDSTKVETKAVAAQGQALRWGEVEATQYSDDNAQSFVQFRVPLVARSERIGQLWVTTSTPTLWATAMEAAEVAPIAILVPLLLVGIGAAVLKRQTQPLDGVYNQLMAIARQPAATQPELQPVSSRHRVAKGWNRLVDSVGRVSSSQQTNEISDRVAEAIRARRQNNSLQVLESISDGLAVTDAQGRITFANRAIEALLGAEDDSMKASGQSVEAYLAGHVDDADALRELLDSTVSRTARAEVKRTAGDRERVLRVARQPLQDDEGYVWSVRDVTQQKLAEEMRNQFIDAATHELRTPLANIKAYAETLTCIDDVDIEQQKEFCNTINAEATRLARFVDELLSVSSMEVGSLAIARQNVQIERLLEEVVDKVKPLMQKKSQKFEVELPPKMGEAHLDKDKMSAMLVNLLGNASKYTPANGMVALRVNVADQVASIQIQDSGVGIVADELPHVFEKFFRSNDPRVQSETGTGLGLAIAREVVRLHGGEIKVESVLNEGSTFTVTIPLIGEEGA